MSSYFDTASAMFSKALKDGHEDIAKKVVSTVLDTYGSYMAWIGKRISAEARPAFEILREKWLKIIARPLVDDMDLTTGMSWLISDLHDFAHAVGQAGLKTHDGRSILDNPYVAVKTDLIIQAQRGA